MDDTYDGVMKARISATELGRDLAAILDRVRRQRYSFLIEQDGEAVATLEPVGAAHVATWRTLTEELRGWSIGDVDFAADLEEVQRNQPDMPATAWPS